ncbi:unnamed protein product, partial [Didymodactylos carnosus]
MNVTMDLIRKDGSLSFGHLVTQVHTKSTINLDLSLSASYTLKTSEIFPIGPRLTLIGYSFSIASVAFGIDVGFEIEIPWSVQLDAIGSLTAGIQYKLDINITLSVDDQNKQAKDVQYNLEKIYHPVRADFQADLIIDVPLKSSLSVQALVFNIGITTGGYLTFENQFRFPPFSPIPSNEFNWNIEHPSLFHLSYPNDACVSKHFIEYHIKFGIRHTVLYLRIDILDQIPAFIKNFVSYFETPSFLDLGPCELVGGCLFEAPQNDFFQSLELFTNNVFSSDLQSSIYFSKSIIYDLSQSLQVSESRIYFNASYPYYDQSTNTELTVVSISILPSPTQDITDPDVSRLVQNLITQEMNQNSTLYSGIFTSSLVQQQTIQANIVNGLMTSFTSQVTTTNQNSTHELSSYPYTSSTPLSSARVTSSIKDSPLISNAILQQQMTNAGTSVAITASSPSQRNTSIQQKLLLSTASISAQHQPYTTVSSKGSSQSYASTSKSTNTTSSSNSSDIRDVLLFQKQPLTT